MTNPLINDDPLAPLLLGPAQGPAVSTRYRSGQLVAWDVTTGENTVRVDGVDFTNLSILPGSYLAVVEEGDTVALLSTTDERGVSTYAIQGLSITPPDSRIAVASMGLGYVKYERRAGELAGTTTSATYVTFANAGPVSFFKAAQTSRVEYIVSGTLYTNGAAGVQLGVRVDGSTDQNVLPINATNELDLAHTNYSHSVIIDEDLDAGAHTFEPLWLRITGAGTLTVDGGDVLTITIREVLPHA